MVRRSTPKTIFVGYAYNSYPKSKYRAALRALEKTFNILFIFADEKFTNLHVFEKVISMMKGADICLFDLTDWNPNVTLELGVAYEAGLEWLSCYNPKKTGKSDVISDLRGFDRFEYKDLKELSGKLANALESRVERKISVVAPDKAKRNLADRIRIILSSGKGFRADQLAAATEADIDQIQVVLEDMISNKEVRSKGATRGRSYYLKQ